MEVEYDSSVGVYLPLQDNRWLEIMQQSAEALVNPQILWQQNFQETNTRCGFSVVCRPKWCVWCLRRIRKAHKVRTFDCSRIEKMLDEASKRLRPYGSDYGVRSPRPICKELEKVLYNNIRLGGQLARDHGIYLRACRWTQFRYKF